MASAIPPTDASIDALFAKARSAKIVAGPGFPGGTLLAVDAGELATLRETLRIVESDERFHCMCLGDLAVELRGQWLAAGRVSYHHGQSVRVDGWCSDAHLVDGPALLRFLSARGVAGPLEEWERARAEERVRTGAREAWVSAAPEAIRAELAALEHGPLGMPRRLEPHEIEALLARIRAGRDDATLAAVLLAWLAVGRGPWSGYAAYEALPMRLLEGLPITAAVAAATAPGLGDATIAAAARFFGDHEIVSFRKSALASVPDDFFARARPLLRHDDDRARHDHAARVAAGARRKRGAPYPIGDGLTVIGESVDGPLCGLAADGEALLSSDVRTLVRFEPGAVDPVRVADAGDTFVWISPTAPFTWATGRRGAIATPEETLATGENGPMEIAASRHGVAWIARHGQDARALRAVVAGDPTVRTLATDGLLWCLCVDGNRALFVEAGWRGGGTLRAVPLAGGDSTKLASIPELGPSMGTPRCVFEGGELLITAREQVLAIDARGRTRILLDARAPIQSIAADATRIALVVAAEGDRDSPWSLVTAPREGGAPRTIGNLARAPYHRHPLVIARGHACTIAGDRLVAAPLDA